MRELPTKFDVPLYESQFVQRVSETLQEYLKEE
jgi:hypothetical protein